MYEIDVFESDKIELSRTELRGLSFRTVSKGNKVESCGGHSDIVPVISVDWEELTMDSRIRVQLNKKGIDPLKFLGYEYSCYGDWID